MMNFLKKSKKHFIGLGLIVTSNAALAASVGTLAEDWGGSVSAIQVLLVLGAALVGLGMMAAGAMQLKKHGENPQQVPLNKGLIFLASGALLFGLSATSETMLDTVFGEGEADGSTDIESDF